MENLNELVGKITLELRGGIMPIISKDHPTSSTHDLRVVSPIIISKALIIFVESLNNNYYTQL